MQIAGPLNTFKQLCESAVWKMTLGYYYQTCRLRWCTKQKQFCTYDVCDHITYGWRGSMINGQRGPIINVGLSSTWAHYRWLTRLVGEWWVRRVSWRLIQKPPLLHLLQIHLASRYFFLLIQLCLRHVWPSLSLHCAVHIGWVCRLTNNVFYFNTEQ